MKRTIYLVFLFFLLEGCLTSTTELKIINTINGDYFIGSPYSKEERFGMWEVIHKILPDSISNDSFIRWGLFFRNPNKIKYSNNFILLHADKTKRQRFMIIHLLSNGKVEKYRFKDSANFEKKCKTLFIPDSLVKLEW